MKRSLNKFKLTHIAAVDKPAQEGALAVIMKGQTAMTTETEATEQLRKNLASGAYKNWTPDDFDLLIKELASDHARPGESEAQAYTRKFAAEAPSETREDRIA